MKELEKRQEAILSKLEELKVDVEKLKGGAGTSTQAVSLQYICLGRSVYVRVEYIFALPILYYSQILQKQFTFIKFCYLVGNQSV